VTPQETVNQNIATGAVAGSLIGGGLGAAIGSASGHVGTGAAIGAGTGLLLGTLAGSDRGYAYGRSAQRRYDTAYQQCMYAKGNQVPGVVEPSRRVHRRMPPPPPPDLDSTPPDYPGSYDAPGQPSGSNTLIAENCGNNRLTYFMQHAIVNLLLPVISYIPSLSTSLSINLIQKKHANPAIKIAMGVIKSAVLKPMRSEIRPMIIGDIASPRA